MAASRRESQEIREKLEVLLTGTDVTLGRAPRFRLMGCGAGKIISRAIHPRNAKVTRLARGLHFMWHRVRGVGVQLPISRGQAK